MTEFVFLHVLLPPFCVALALVTNLAAKGSTRFYELLEKSTTCVMGTLCFNVLVKEIMVKMMSSNWKAYVNVMSAFLREVEF